jgi:hypothetical protein
VTDHAAERYRERVRPELTLEEARSELVRLTRTAPAVEPPAWMRRRDAGPTLMLGGGAYGVCRPMPRRRGRWQLTTILTQELASEL